MTKPTVTIAGEEVKLGVPSSIAARYDLLACGGSNLLRAQCAALGMAWAAGGSPGAPKARYASCDYNAAVYGGAVLEELHKRGLNVVREVIPAAREALALLTEDLITADEVDAAEGNSEPEAISAGSSDEPSATSASGSAASAS